MHGNKVSRGFHMATSLWLMLQQPSVRGATPGSSMRIPTIRFEVEAQKPWTVRFLPLFHGYSDLSG